MTEQEKELEDRHSILFHRMARWHECPSCGCVEPIGELDTVWNTIYVKALKANHRVHRTLTNQRSFDQCLTCALLEPCRTEKKNKVKKLLHSPDFLRGTTEEWKMSQLLSMATLDAMMCTPEYFGLFGFRSFQDLKNFLMSVYILPVLLNFMKFPRELFENPGDHFFLPLVIHYSIEVLGVLASPEDMAMLALHDPTEKRNVAKVVDKVIANGEIIPELVNICKGKYDITETMKATHVLHIVTGMFSSDAKPAACKQVMECDVLPHLVQLFTPGYFQKVVAKRRDDGFIRHVKAVLALGMNESIEAACPFLIPNDEVYVRAIFRSSGVQENSGVVLTNIASISNEYMLKVFDTPGCVSTMFKWIQHPILLDNFDQNGSTAAVQLLQFMLKDRVLANFFVEEKNLLQLIERQLYMQVSWPLDEYIAAAEILAGYGRPFIGLLAANRNILVALGSYIHSTHSFVCPNAFRLLYRLVKNCPRSITTLFDEGLLTRKTLVQFERTCQDPIPTIAVGIKNCCSKHLGERWTKSDQNATQLMKKQKLKDCEFWKTRGNRYFLEENYRMAINNYDVALLIADPVTEAPTVLSNRAECYLRLGQYQEVVRDCTRAVCYDFETTCEKLYVKTLYRRAQAMKALKRPFEALGDVATCVRSKIKDEKFQKLYDEVLVEYRKLEGVVFKLRTCGGCNVNGEGMKKCARCDVYFCSRTCQKYVWPEHKKVCGK